MGAPWRDLLECYSKWQTVANHFYRWQKAGIWDRLFAEIRRQVDMACYINWAIHYAGGTAVRAHQHATGARREPGSQSPKRVVLYRCGSFQLVAGDYNIRSTLIPNIAWKGVVCHELQVIFFAIFL